MVKFTCHVKITQNLFFLMQIIFLVGIEWVAKRIGHKLLGSLVQKAKKVLNMLAPT